MGRPRKVFHQQNAQKLMRAVLSQACLDALSDDPAEKADALDFLLTDRSDFVLLSQGVSEVENFRAGLRQRLTQKTVEVWAEQSKPATFAGLVRRAA
jgi:hypothetical protein